MSNAWDEAVVVGHITAPVRLLVHTEDTKHSGQQHENQTEMSRAGHATTLPKQCGHAFRPHSCWLLHYYSIRGELNTPFRHARPDNFQIFSCP